MGNTVVDPTLLDGMKFRCIGPPRGGRVLAVAGHPTETATFYFGGCAGGIWKSEDAGTYWENISDGFLNSAAIGALAIAPSDPNVIYAGTGEATIRGDVSFGDGVYKSTDGGATWANIGLQATKHIAKIRVHPTDPDRLYVAAFGHGFGPNEERGVYRSTDGGGNWERVLHVSDKAGAVDLSLDAKNPRVLYAAIYECYRNFWSLNSGGPDSGLWKSTDGGDTWTELTANKGMPEGIKGKIGVAVSPADSQRVWAIIESDGSKAGIYRSDDGGATWKQASSNRDLIHRPWYYCHVFADPKDENLLYVLNLGMWKSTDGGENWTEITTPHGDNHDLWIDPANPRRMIEGNDGGACVSFNAGESWSTIYNQLTGQFYHVAVDNQYPYRVYGTQQDNSSISVPSATEKGAIPWGDCYAAGTGESGYIAVHPTDSDIVYVGAIGSSPGGGGALQRYDHRTKQVRLITVWPEANYGRGAIDLKYRFAWTYPIAFSPHDSRVLYTAGNHLFRSTDEGSSWEIISPDLTRGDPETLQPSGGPLTLDTSGAEVYGTIFAFVESMHEQGLFWAGSDDGLLHISRDSGATWKDVTPADLGERTLISIIEQSPHDSASVYVASTRYKLNEYRPILHRTTDYGQSWQSLAENFPTSEITRVIRQDPEESNLLFVGTETGIFVSFNAGVEWQRLACGLPIVPVYDMVVKGSDLIVGTHGRAFWILDDLTPLRLHARGGDARLLPPRTTVRQWQGWSVGAFRGPGKNYMLGLGTTVAFREEPDEHNVRIRTVLDGGENPPRGVIVYYRVDSANEQPLKLTFLDRHGNVVRTFTSRGADTSEDAVTLSTVPGLNRFVWDMYYENATMIDDVTTEKSITGPMAAPGRYSVLLTQGDINERQDFEIVVDPRVDVSQADLDAQFELWEKLSGRVSAAHQGVERLRGVREQVAHWAKRSKQGSDDNGLAAIADAIVEKLTTIEVELVQTGAVSARDRLRLPAGLNAKLITLMSVVASADARPPQQAYDVFDQLSTQLDEQLQLLDGVLGDDIAALNDQIKAADIAPIAI